MTTGRSVAFRLQGSYLLWRPFPWPSTRCGLCNSLERPAPLLVDPTTPARQRHRAVTPCGFRLFPVRSPLLRESRLLSLPRLTEMFQFGRFPPQALCVQTWVTGHDPGRVSPFGHPRITAFLAAPRGFSQPDASFIGSWRQGIHREPLLTWPVIDARARYRVLKVLEVARTSRTEQCARHTPPVPTPAVPLPEGRTSPDV
jgi:hypothetical protein